MVGGANVPEHLDAPAADRADLDSVIRAGRAIAIYPEIVPGNPWGAAHVIRFLLNKPGIASRDQSGTYGDADFFIAFDRSHAPAGRSSFDLFVPLVDRRFYHTAAQQRRRTGFVLCARRPPPAEFRLPPWVSPVTMVTPQQPKTHAELGSIYRRSRALIAYERTSAIYEALACGCPVLCISSNVFKQETFQLRFGGAGLCWVLDSAALTSATASVPEFAAAYTAIETDFPRRVEGVFTHIVADIESSPSPARQASRSLGP
jgi:hypothetical protein